MGHIGQVGLFYHEACSRHDTGWNHPEHQGRLRAVMGAFRDAYPELRERLEFREGRPVDEGPLERVHDPEYIRHVRETADRAAEAGRTLRLDPDTAVSGASWDAARAACGCAVDAVRAVASGELRSAFCATRPPGHHATPTEAMGFCLFNHVAVAARHALDRGLAERVLVVDWDVHHGNGTQETFYSDPAVFYFSVHQSPFYPGTGAAEETGEGPGEGTTLNRPMSAGLAPERYVEAFREGLEEIGDRGFDPDLVLVSAGFDGSDADPLGGFTLGDAHFRTLTRELVRRTREAAGGRVVSVLEGGYDPDALAGDCLAHVRALIDSAAEEEAGSG